MNIVLQIADIIFKVIDYPFDEISDSWKPFVINDENEADFTYHVQIYEDKPNVEGKCILEESSYKVYMGEDYECVAMKHFETGYDWFFYPVFERGKNEATIYIPSDYDKMRFGYSFFKASMLINYVMIDFKRIVMHASVVCHKGEAMLFTGPSGMGKSTQAGLWQQYRDADILNGDRATLDLSGEQVLVFGSPYAGSSDIYRNEYAPVRAIILLSQSKENSIEKLEGSQLFYKMFPRFSIAQWDEKLLNMSIDLIQEVLARVPVYHLSCYPGEEAVSLVEQELFNK